jgi:hypothetical protein
LTVWPAVLLAALSLLGAAAAPPSSTADQSRLATTEEAAALAGLPEDLGCLTGKHAAAWTKAKQKFRALFNEAGPFDQLSREKVSATLDEAVAEITAVGGFASEASEECGAGRLFIHLLSLTSIDEPAVLAQFFQEHEAMASPVMTLLLDVPWVSVALSGWPFFGVLQQVGLHKLSVLGDLLNKDAVDNLENESTRTYFDALMLGKKMGQMDQMVQASNTYIQKMPREGNALGTLTALSTQAALEMNPKKRVEALQVIQTGFKQALTSPAELDIVLTTRWPLWGFVHVGVDSFSDY